MGSSLRSLAAPSISSELSALETTGLGGKRLVGTPRNGEGPCAAGRGGLHIEPSSDCRGGLEPVEFVGGGGIEVRLLRLCLILAAGTGAFVADDIGRTGTGPEAEICCLPEDLEGDFVGDYIHTVSEEIGPI